MLFFILSLLPAAFMGVYHFGWYALFIIIISISTAIITEAIIQKLRKKEITVYSGGAFTTGLLLALVLPSTVPLWIPIVGSFVAIAIAKHAFGSRSHIFNPALVGRAFLVASWPALMTTWIYPDGITAATPLAILKLEGTEALSNFFGSMTETYRSLFLGNIAGTIGETSALALLIGAIFLFYNRIIDWRIPTAYIGTVLVLSIILKQNPLIHILCGGLLLGAFFMATDCLTTPITKSGRLVFGFSCGLLTIIMRLYSNLPEGVMYSILFMNALTPLIDRFTKPRPFGWKNE
jgi:electron transport complex protein RnfD